MEKIQQLVNELNTALGTLDFIKKSIVNNLQPILDSIAQDMQTMEAKIKDLEEKVKTLEAQNNSND